MSLKIEKKNEGTKDTVMLSGRLDTTTAPELDVFAEKELADTQELRSANTGKYNPHKDSVDFSRYVLPGCCQFQGTEKEVFFCHSQCALQNPFP
jgi:hypothetical protein